MMIHVSNLTYNITTDSLSAAFAAYGKVTATTILKDPSAVPTIYYARVEMPNPAEAKQAIDRLNGAILDGRFIAVQPYRAIQKATL